MPATTEQLVRRAIAERRWVELQYDGLVRIGEPHVLGIREGVKQVLMYQIRGASKSGRLPQWRCFVLDRISALTLLDKTFAGGRPAPSGKHAVWDEQLAYVP